MTFGSAGGRPNANVHFAMDADEPKFVAMLTESWVGPRKATASPRRSGAG